MDEKFIERPKKFDRNDYDKEYKKSHYKRIGISVKPEIYNIIDTYCKDNEIDKTNFIITACMNYIDNH